MTSNSEGDVWDSFGQDVAVSRVDVSVERSRWSDAVKLVAEYHLRATDSNPSRILVYDSGELAIEHVGCSVATDIRHGRQHGVKAMEILRKASASFDGATIQFRARWDRQTVRQLKGSPICMLPWQLPHLSSRHGFYYPMGAFTDPANGVELQRLTVREPLQAETGVVLDEQGQLLSAAVPFGDRFLEHIFHADDVLVFGGKALSSLPLVQRTMIRDRLLDIHRFVADELGRGDRVRALVVCDEKAFDFVHGLGQYGALDDRHLIQLESGRFVSERIVARNIAGVWWHYGVRPAGLLGPTLALALSQYCVIRWFESRGVQEGIDNEIKFLQKLLRQRDATAVHGLAHPSGSAELALMLWEAGKNGPGLRNELRRLCTESWGRTVPVRTILARLKTVGVRWPSERTMESI